MPVVLMRPDLFLLSSDLDQFGPDPQLLPVFLNTSFKNVGDFQFRGNLGQCFVRIIPVTLC